MIRTATVLTLLLALAAGARGDDGARQALAAELSRATTAEGKAALADLLARDPVGALAHLPWALPLAFPEGDWQSAQSQAVQAAVTDAVTTAFLAAPDPRVFLSAAADDELPPVVLGVVRGVVQTLGRGVRSGDQGAPDYEAFLCGFTGFEDTPEVRAHACEGLALLPASRAGAHALLRALQDPEARVARAARAALTRLSGGRADTTAWRAWAQGLPGALAVPAYDVLPWLFVDPGARERTERVQLLTGALAARPDELLGVLHEELTALEPDAAREALLADVVAAALARADQDRVGPFLEDAPRLHTALARGVARGIADRVAPVARRRPADDREQPRPLPPLAEELRDALERLAVRPEAEVQLDVFRALPALVQGLDETWFALLVPCLEDERPTVRQAAWSVLKALSHQDLGPAPAFWRQWWTTARGAEEGR